jgi:hypothetical protein
MPKYGELVYGTNIKYGELSKTTLSAEPLTSIAIDYHKINLTWVKPSGTYVGFRIVRNQNAFPETEEDGTIIYEWFSPSTSLSGYSSTSPFSDESNSLVSGRFVYYRAWILVSATGEWVRAGQTYTLIPKSNVLNDSTNLFSTTHDRFLSFLPRVMTSSTNSPLDEINNSYNPRVDVLGVNENTLISKFFEGFSFTIDEFLTFAKLILPSQSAADSSPSILALQSLQLGLPLDPRGITRQQKRLVREAVRIYKGKGTKKSLDEFAESMTSFSPSTTETNNLLLSIQDSTFNIPSWFEGAVGRWVHSDNATISVDTSIAAPTETYSLDPIFLCKIVTSTTLQDIGLGIDEPITRGIPVTGGKYYQFSYYTKSLSGTATTTDTIYWYDRNGVIISSSSNSAVTAGTSWGTRNYFNAQAPAEAVYAGVGVVFSAASSYWIDMVQFAKVTSDSSALETYYEPRGVKVFLNPTKTNYITNPSFETSATSSWNFSYASGSAPTPTQVATTVGGIYDGPVGARTQNFKGKFVSSSSSVSTIKTSVTVPTGNYYTFSFYARAESALSNTTLKLISGTYDGSTKSATTTVTIDSTAWKRYSVSVFLPQGSSTTTTLEASIYGSWGGKFVYLDCAQLEQSAVQTDYFDGAITGVSWAGTANESASYSYPNRDAKLQRFSNYIKNFLPLNTPYYIDYYSDSVLDTKYSGIA